MINLLNQFQHGQVDLKRSPEVKHINLFICFLQNWWTGTEQNDCNKPHTNFLTECKTLERPCFGIFSVQKIPMYREASVRLK